MAKIPQKPEDIFTDITDDYRRVFASDLISIILYGSGASGHYVAGKSDLNFLVVLTEQGMGRLDEAFDLAAKWKKRRVAAPLLMTKGEVRSSLDAYPVEILNMSLHYVLVFGEDVLANLIFNKECLRLQLERELRGKLFLLRQGFLRTEGKENILRELIRVSLTAFLSAFSALLYLKGMDIPKERAALLAAAEEAYAIDKDLFHKCLDIRKGRDRFSKEELARIFRDYVREIAVLCDKVDNIKL